LVQFGVLLVAVLKKDNSRCLSFSLALPLLVGDRWSGYVCVLVWFHLGILILILMSVLCCIPDRLSSDFLGTSMMKGCKSWRMGRLSSSS
jgi:hypothetical protein